MHEFVRAKIQLFTEISVVIIKKIRNAKHLETNYKKSENIQVWLKLITFPNVEQITKELKSTDLNEVWKNFYWKT